MTQALEIAQFAYAVFGANASEVLGAQQNIASDSDPSHSTLTSKFDAYFQDVLSQDAQLTAGLQKWQTANEAASSVTANLGVVGGLNGLTSVEVQACLLYTSDAADD